MNCKLKFQTLVRAMIICALLFNFSLNLCAEERVGEIKYENGFYYTIQKGDTLWDLSQKFSDSPITDAFVSQYIRNNRTSTCVSS